MSIYLGGLNTDTTPDRRIDATDLEPDARISNLRPGWLDDDQQWREQFGAFTVADAKWLAEQWRLAGGPEPAVDVSWVTFERRRRWS